MAVDMVLSIIAEDRPGLVQTLAQVLADHGGNWIDSSMARLGGEFAGIVRVAVADDRAAAFEQALGALGEKGIAVTVRRDTPLPPRSGTSALLEVTGADRAGIVHQISQALAEAGVSIEALKTEVFSGSMSGGKLFSAEARILMPEGCTAPALRERLEAIAEDIMVDLELVETD